ncbi:MAG TPA: hypothetical protein PL133_07520 [Methylophilaceae bacterium]|nr:hypothetical protein [Methylophilaceae bacterium]HQC28726.1 hypothetical protein [Methylotenera sp.]
MNTTVNNYQHGLETGYFHIDQDVVPYDFIAYIRSNFDPYIFDLEQVLSIHDVFDKNFIDNLPESKLRILPACLAIIASHPMV